MKTATAVRAFTAAEVVAVMAGQAETQTERTAKMLASAIGVVLARFGETEITIAPHDLGSLARTHRVAIIPTQDARTFTYRLVRIAKDDDETASLLLTPSG